MVLAMAEDPDRNLITEEHVRSAMEILQIEEPGMLQCIYRLSDTRRNVFQDRLTAAVEVMLESPEPVSLREIDDRSKIRFSNMRELKVILEILIDHGMVEVSEAKDAKAEPDRFLYKALPAGEEHFRPLIQGMIDRARKSGRLRKRFQSREDRDD